ncbi:DUF2298 domain-containing protein [Patescibacteria group bacterium]|nr:DUF2298 domain-containing protein [Patescibacteria group bacterium]
MEIVFIIIKNIIFWGVIFAFGFELARFVLRGAAKEICVALAGFLGIGLYVFTVNILGHFFDIRFIFYAVLVLFLGCAAFSHFKNKSAVGWGIDGKWRKIIFGTAVIISVVSFVVDWRHPLAGDQLTSASMPQAETIASGNFPPQAIWLPPYPARYHYGSMLLAAAIKKTTGAPLYSGYDLQVGFLAGTLFLLGFILIKRLLGDNKKALAGSVLMLYAGSLTFLKGFHGISLLYSKYFLHQNIAAPFKFVFDIVSPLLAYPPVKAMTDFPQYALAFVLMLGIAYLYFFTPAGPDRKKIIFLCGLLLATLALFAETFFAVFCGLLLVAPFLFLFQKNSHDFKKYLGDSAFILLIALPISFLQGGVMTHYLGMDGHNLMLHETYGYTNLDLMKGGFEISWRPWFYLTRLGGPDYKLGIWEPEFIMQWGLLVALVAASSVYFIKKRKRGFLLITTAFFSFFILPLFVLFPVEPVTTERFFLPASLFGGLIVGAFLADIYFFPGQKRWLKLTSIFLGLTLVVQAALFQLIYLTIGYPSLKFNNTADYYAQKGSFEYPAYEWVKKSTTIKDYFLKIEVISRQFAPNLKFVLNTGRLAPVYAYTLAASPYNLTAAPINIFSSYAFRELQKTCRADLLKTLNYSYIYVDQDWPTGLEEKCLANSNLEPVFKASDGEQFTRIYKIK